jgi:hypothetical protein
MCSLGPRDSDLRMAALARTSSTCKATDPSSRERGCYISTMTASVQLKIIIGLESRDELTGGKPPVESNSSV